MCGVAGYSALSKDSVIDERLLFEMQKSLSHRGPDGYGIWKSDEHGVGFCHRRLSIVDLSAAAKQPMISIDGAVVITFNGEIYNHLFLRKELEKKGYVYLTAGSDTETLLYAYQEWGIEFLHKLEGEFAFVLFDKKNNELYAVRDRIGVKPLYFSLKNNFFSFASEIKALWQLPWVKKEINQQAMYHYFTFMVPPAPLTLYKEVYKLPAGFYIKIDASKAVTFHEWYSPLQKISLEQKKEFENESFCIENTRFLINEAVKKRMMADVPVGVFLSGGIDSSLNVALMSQYTKNLKTFNVSFSDGPEHSEQVWARKVAALYGTEHHEIVISEKEAFDFSSKMVYHQDEPLADCVCIPLYYVARLAKEAGITVVQIGEGSDELFCGYSTYTRIINFYNKMWNPSQNVIPHFLRKGAATLIKSNPFIADRYGDLMHDWVEKRNLFWGGAIAFREQAKKSLYSSFLFQDDPILRQIYKGMSQSGDSYSIVEYHLAALYDKAPDSDFLKSMIYLELKQRLPELLLMRADKMSMATSVESRVPFLDHTLVEFALNIPSRFKYKNGVTKYILKKACEGILPHEIIYREKIGFAAPISRWFRDDSFFKKSLSKYAFSRSKFTPPNLNLSYIQSMLEKHKSRKFDYSVELWVFHNLMNMLECNEVH